MIMNRYMHMIGWKVDNKWDKYEVLVDVCVIETVLLVGATINWIL